MALAGDRERDLPRPALGLPAAAVALRLPALAHGTVCRRFSTWRDTGLFETINPALVMADRERSGRDASPTGAIIDSQRVKTTESGGPRGCDAGRRVKGRKRPRPAPWQQPA